MSETAGAVTTGSAAALDEPLLRALVRTSHDGIAVIEPDGRIRYMNPAMERLLGATIEECPTLQNVVARNHPEPAERARLVGLFQEDLCAVEPPDREALMVRADGSRVWCRMHLAHLRDGSVVINGQDVTARKNAEEETREKSRMLEGILANMPVVTFRFDERGVFTESLGAGLKRLGLRSGQVVGMNVFDFYPQMAEKFRRAIAGELVMYEGEGEHNGAPWYFSTCLFPDPDRPGSVIGFALDITRQRDLERQTLHSQKMAAMGQLAQRVAHDFTNELVPILGGAQLARDRMEEMSESRYILDDVIQSAERVASLTAELLAFARPLPPSLRVLSLEGIVRGMQQVLERALGPDVALELSLDSESHAVSVDPALLEQALVHLVINASEAMPSGGRVTLGTRRAAQSERDTLSSTMNPAAERKSMGEYVVLTVRDTGVGISRDCQSRVFEPFYTTKKDSKNVGLGLTTVYSIVARNNGYVTVESEAGRGAEFRIFLPVV